MRHYRLGLVGSAGVMLALAWPSHARQVTWDGECGTVLWNSMCGNPMVNTNWMPNVIPTGGDDVTISGSVVTISGVIGNCSSISCTSGLNITNGGQLYVQNAGGSVQNLSLINASVRSGVGTLQIYGNSTTGGGAVYGPGDTWNTGSLSGLSLTLKNQFGPPTFLNTQGGEMSISSIQIDPGATLKNINATLTLVPHQQVSGGGINASSGGTGVFHNESTFITQHDGTAHSQFFIGSVMKHFSGDFKILGTSNSLGTSVAGNATFSGGQITVSENAHLRFGPSGAYEFNGLSSISGGGNLFLQINPSPGPQQWLISSNLDVNMTGSTGFMLDTGRIILNNTLTNQGKAQWKGMTIRSGGCTGCTSRFVNQSADFMLDTGASSNAVTLDASFENLGTFTHKQGHLKFDDEALFLNSAEYRLIDGDIDRINALYTNEFVNNGNFIKPDDLLTQDSQVSTVFRNMPGATVTVEKLELIFNQGGLKIEGGNFAVALNAELTLFGSTHTVVAGQPIFVGEGYCWVAHGTLRVDESAEAKFDLHGPADAGLRLSTNGHLGGAGTIRNTGRFRWTQGTLGVTDGAGGFSADFINQNQAVITNGTATLKGIDSTYTNIHGATTDQFNGHVTIDDGLVINRGMWLVSDGTVNVSGDGLFLNDAVESAIAGGNPNGVFRCEVDPLETVTVSCQFDNQGVVSAKAGNLVFTGPIVQLSNPGPEGELTGGTWVVHAGATLDLPGVIKKIGPNAKVEAPGNFKGLECVRSNEGNLTAGDKELCGNLCPCNIALPFHNAGFVKILPPEVPVGASITVPGEVDNSTLGYMSNDVVIDFAGGSAPYIALDCDALNNAGTLAPGGTGTPGAFFMIGDFNQSETGILEIELAGLMPVDEHDQLIVNGNVTLAGTLRVEILAGYVPRGGEQFTILTATNGTISGQFDAIVGAGKYSIAVQSNDVVLTLDSLPIPGDIDGDGSVNVDDLLAVINAWGGCPPPCPPHCPADVNDDCSVNVDDLLLVINNWG